jgi:hypothetical protein
MRERTKAIKEGRGDPLVDASVARAHLLALSAVQIGRRTVSQWSGVADSTLAKIRTGRQLQIRKQTERRILEVPVTAHRPGALVPAQPTWELIFFLRKHGWAKVHIARAIGQRGSGLQLSRRQITAHHAALVRRLYLREWLRLYKPVKLFWRTSA